jgi:hypothetical protein
MGYRMKSTKDTILGRDTGNLEVPSPELTEAEKRALYQEALEVVAKEAKAKRSEELLEEYKKIARRELIPEEELEPVLIDLAGHSTKISLDGKQFFHGVTYYFSKAQAATVREIMHRGWKHEAEIKGANSNAYRKPNSINLTPSDAYTNPTHLMRV